MDYCDYCGEYKKVRKEVSIDGRHEGKFFPFNYLCKDCDEAQKIIAKQRIEELKKKRIEKQKEWRIERDKILKENA